MKVGLLLMVVMVLVGCATVVEKPPIPTVVPVKEIPDLSTR